jgi:hypothetical protein
MPTGNLSATENSATDDSAMINVFNLSTASDPQIFPVSGGQSGSLNVYLSFATYPSTGFVAIDRRKPGSDVWESLHNNQVITIGSAPISLKTDGGVSAFRVTLAGLNGGASPMLAIVGNETATPPGDLLTDGGFGSKRRIRVDPGQTGFFAGKFFRSYIEAVIPVAGPSVQFRFTSPINFILWSQVLQLMQGAIELRVYTGATSSGVWTARPVIGVNRMTEIPQPPYVSQITLETGGNFTGGTEVDVLKVRTSSANNTAQNVGSESTERGLPAGVYHGRLQTLTGGLTVNDAAQLLYSLVWEERP